MSSIVIGSVNCRGLADSVKRCDIFTKCKDLYDVTVLVDTHGIVENEKKWLHEWGYIAKFSSFTSNSRGVAILFKNSFEFKIHDEVKDTLGNYIILDISIQDYRMTLAAIYGPNEDKPCFFEILQSKINIFPNSSIILVGDWNVVQDYNLDTVNYRRENNINSKLKLHSMMNDLDLIDIWREQHQNDRKFSWRGPSKKQSRLDYFLTTTDIGSFVVSSEIGISYRSDHSPVTITIKFSNQSRGRGTWKFNNSLLHEGNFILKVKEDIKNVMLEYETDHLVEIDNVDKEFTITNQLLWEMIKMKIRGSAISFSSFKKRQKDKKEKELQEKLIVLDKQYTENLSEAILCEMEKIESEIKTIREEKVNGIIMRAKAKWQVEGEKSTQYFCNLEKKHYLEKIIPKLILENKQEISDPKQIRNEQKDFYNKLYTSTNPCINASHRDIFFNDNNPFIIKPDADEVNSCEGLLTIQECLASLKKMKNCKSPGIDGFTVEFYKFFWNDIKIPLVKCLNESLDIGKFSTSQRQGLITCIPKEGKSKFYLKNWRPITLLCVDFKIASASIANRVKPILQNIISPTQKGFLKGRYIGECTRIIYDLIDKMEEEDIPGILLLVDFEKAFDTIEWSFIESALEFYGFGPVFQKWIKTFYCDISSSVLNNGHMSRFFTLERGVRQGDPLSPYLFILILELLSSAIKNDPNINGVKINDSEFLLSQYADDSSLVLEDDPQSLDNSIKLFHKFTECAGLRINIDKTEAIWIGSRKGCSDKLLPELNLSWNFSGKFKLLGIHFDLLQKDKTLINFTEKIKSIKGLLNTWCYRELTYIGRITVIKTLALPILIQSLTVLPNPPEWVIKEIQDVFYNFLWNGKNDKIKHTVMINGYEEGGLKMPHIKSFCCALKMSWINKLLDPLNFSPWKTLLLSSIQRWGGDNILYLNKKGLEVLAGKLNPFWNDVFCNFSELKSMDSEICDINDVLSQSIWFNPFIKINGNMCFHSQLCENGIFFINDLISPDNKKLYTFNEFVDTYNVNINFVEYYGIISAIPNNWKQLILEENIKLDRICNEIVDKIKAENKPCKYFYKLFILRVQKEPINCHKKWENDLETSIEDWHDIFSLSFCVTKDTNLQNFQFKLLHRILPVNPFLYKCGLKETELCTFCMETKENLLHLFWNCNLVKNFWFAVKNFLMICGIALPLTAREITLGISESDIENQNTVNNILLILKCYIYKCRCKGESPHLHGGLQYLKYYIKIEKNSTFYMSPKQTEQINQKWLNIDAAMNG